MKTIKWLGVALRKLNPLVKAGEATNETVGPIISKYERKAGIEK